MKQTIDRTKKPAQPRFGALGAAWAAFDQRLMLRQPRLWSLRGHVVLLCGVLAYLAIAAIAFLVLRPVFLPRPESFLRGEHYQGLSTLPKEFATSIMLTTAINEHSTQLAGLLTLLGASTALIGAILAVIWLRAQARFSIEQVYGNQLRGGAWLEWLSYVVCSACFACFGLWLHFCMMPFPGQHAASAALKQSSIVAVNEIAQSKGVRVDVSFRDEDNIDFWSVARALYGTSAEGHNVMLLVPPKLDFKPISALKSPVGPFAVSGRYDWSLTASPNSAEQRYLQQVANHTFILAHGVTSLASTSLLAFVVWLVGCCAYLLFAIKRAPRRNVIMAVLFGALGLPFLTLIGTLIITPIYYTLVYGLGGPGRFSSPAPAFVTNMFGILVAYIVVLAVCAFGFFATLVAPVYRRFNAMTTLLFPIVLGYLPLIVLNYVWSLPDYVSRYYEESGSRSAYWPMLTIAIGVIPFVFAPLLPLVNKALIRLWALPKNT